MAPRDLLKASLRPGFRRFLALATTYLFAIFPFQTAASAPTLLAHYRFEFNEYDSAFNSPPIQLHNVRIDGTAHLLPYPQDYIASAAIENMSYRSFTVATDFKPLSLGFMHTTILSGGPLYRWLGLQNDDAGHLILTFNNTSSSHTFTNIIATGIWHTVVCTVDWTNKAAIVYLDGEQLPTVQLPGERFEIEGTEFESSNRIFTFRNGGNASRLHGEADNLKVYNRALTPQEVTDIFFTPRIRIVIENDRALIHWHRDLTGYVLETSPSLGIDAHWTQVSDQPVLDADYMAINAVLRGQRFYRLSRR